MYIAGAHLSLLVVKDDIWFPNQFWVNIDLINATIFLRIPCKVWVCPHLGRD